MKECDLNSSDIKGIILSGSPYSVADPRAPQLEEMILKSNKPLLGICYGLHLLVKTLGGKVVQSQTREYGKALLTILEKRGIFEGFGNEMVCWMSHGDSVKEIPPQFQCIARTETCDYAAIVDDQRRIWGIQFHPEVSHTPLGKEILSNFIFNVCGCSSDWTAESIIKQQIQWLRNTAQKEKVICALSGGVDSVTAAVLTYRAIGDQLSCIFVNNGLMRKGEPEHVLRNMEALLGKGRVIAVDAKDRFLNELQGVVDPEQKRKIIGRVFIEVLKKKPEI